MNRIVVSRLRSSRLMRLTMVGVVAGQVLIGTPVLAQDAARVAVRAGTRAAADLQRKVAKARVRVNRTVPAVTPPSLDVTFGAHVTTEAITRAHVFFEPLLPTSDPTADDNRSIGQVLQAVATLPRDQGLARIDAYLHDRPASPWRASLLANAATLYAKDGYFSRAAAYWRQAWELTRDRTETGPKAIADYAVGEALHQMVGFGQLDRVEATLKEIEGRDIRGTAASRVSFAREGFVLLNAHHDMAAFSGPEALKMYLTVAPNDTLDASMRTIVAYHPTMAGTSLIDLRDLARAADLDLEMVHLAPVGDIPVPSVVHLRSQHYSAVVGEQDGHYLLRDPGLGGTFLMSGAALRDEASGYFLVPRSKQHASGARPVPAGEAATVIGHCTPGMPSSEDPPWLIPDLGQCGGDGPGPCGMPDYSFHPTKITAIIDDVPLSYAPPVGPAINFHLTYDHGGNHLPQTIDFGHVGGMWRHNWMSYVSDNLSQIMAPYASAWVLLRGQGRETYGANGPFTHQLTRATLVQVANDPVRYERRLTDGTVEVFALADRAANVTGRRTFLTAIIDPQGHTVALTYDSSFRVVAITDAVGQVTTLAYLDAAAPLRVTRVTDPFGRFATLAYDGSGRLSGVTDVAGLSSSFSYGSGDFIQSMTTPYGTTTFRSGSPSGNRRIEATDPAGGTERLEFHFENLSIPQTAPASDVPTGFSASNDFLHRYNSLYWDKPAMAAGPTLSNATITNWMLAVDIPGGHGWARNVPHSLQRPLESRIWYRYPDQGAAATAHHAHGLGRSPALVGRVLEGGVSQVTTLTYNAMERVTSRIDPTGRQTNYTYATNGLDLLTVEQVRSGGTDVLQTYAGYDARHLPGTITDAAGQTTTLTYNAAGQPLTVTNAKSETTTYAYEIGTGNLLTATGPVSGATMTFAYDAYGRVESTQDAEGYVVLTDYDAFDRVTQRTYPDDTSETFTYTKLSLAEQKDRLGRITRHRYDGFGRLLATTDPAGRTVSQVWCDCGTLEALVDAKGQRTTWERDVQGRVTREIRADNTTDTLYTYDLAGRLKTVTDPMDQVTTYTYNLDDSLSSTGFTNETIATADISHTYDAYYPRPVTMVDGNGTTNYTYTANGTLGAGQLASVDGPLTTDTVTYTYDPLGRVATRLLNGTGTAVTYDPLGRIAQLGFPIGQFAYTFAGHSARVASVTYPNAQTSTYAYFAAPGDFRLQTIHHKNPGAATLSKFDYTYDAVGNIRTWRQERAGAAAKVYTFANDAVDQLTAAVLTDTNTTPTILKRQAWAYDPAGNRTVDQSDDAVFATTHNNMNRLQSRAPGGAIVLSGTVNEAATVTIDGKPATVDAANNFAGTAQVSSGTTTVTVKAKDASGNETTKQYEIDAAGSTTSYTYDANGNLTADGTKTYVWNALNQLVEVKQGATTLATFVYDGEGRRTEKTAAGVTHTYLYDAEDIVEERLSGSTTDTIRYFHGTGIDEPLARKTSADVVTYYLADHLGSIVQETDAAGSVTLQREYDAWGNLLLGASASGYAFTGREWDAETGLFYYRARYYAPTIARFLSGDPLGFGSGSLNYYAYVDGRPAVATDPTGLSTWILTPFLSVLLPTAPAWVVPAVIVTTVAVTGLAIWDLSEPYFNKPPKDSYDPNGPKAPGRPAPESGFQPPKQGDRWVKEPNGSRKGWEDKEGNVWVPTGPGPRAHGGPHWDVQFPGGGYQNVYPGACLVK